MPYDIPVRYLSWSTSHCPFELNVTWNWTSSAVDTVGTSGHIGRCQHHTPPTREQFSKTHALLLKRPQHFTGVYIPYDVLVSILLPLTITASLYIDLLVRYIRTVKTSQLHQHQHVGHHSTECETSHAHQQRNVETSLPRQLPNVETVTVERLDLLPTSHQWAPVPWTDRLTSYLIKTAIIQDTSIEVHNHTFKTLKILVGHRIPRKLSWWAIRPFKIRPLFQHPKSTWSTYHLSPTPYHLSPITYNHLAICKT